MSKKALVSKLNDLHLIYEPYGRLLQKPHTTYEEPTRFDPTFPVNSQWEGRPPPTNDTVQVERTTVTHRNSTTAVVVVDAVGVEVVALGMAMKAISITAAATQIPATIADQIHPIIHM